MSEFNWNEDKDSIVVQPVDAIAVYLNESRDIVIRQQHPMGDDDSFVIVPPQHVEAVIEAIKRAKLDATQ